MSPEPMNCRLCGLSVESGILLSVIRLVSRSQVRPFQISRTAFSLTPKARATLQAPRVWDLFAVWLLSLILKISTACSAVRIALVLQDWIEF